MSQPLSNSLNEKTPSVKKNEVTPDLLSILAPVSQVGIVTGTCGLFVGAIAGIVRSASPVLFSLASGVQFSILGSTITGRQILLHSWSSNEISTRDKLWISAMAGALGGGTSGAILRGRKNIVPGAIMFALFGVTGQALFNKMEYSRQISHSENSRNLNWMNFRWSPLRVISDEEYEFILQNKLMRVRADIALIDEKIETIKTNQHLTESCTDREPTKTQRKSN
ncbi:hypothetical protein GcC1_137003 [Golovinomyces cichoracearum]|uniref:Uncharacterized protein n=1 Tax=Golovinomyces cichoracearum TaxID=62708 RepID=A0A420I228_9PEZI|nr:hypothetical protein GcC1_137003 [Golovinomyces cichoracearum]